MQRKNINKTDKAGSANTQHSTPPKVRQKFKFLALIFLIFGFFKSYGQNSGVILAYSMNSSANPISDTTTHYIGTLSADLDSVLTNYNARTYFKNARWQSNDSSFNYYVINIDTSTDVNLLIVDLYSTGLFWKIEFDTSSVELLCSNPANPDPVANPWRDLRSNQTHSDWYMEKIKAYCAWDETEGLPYIKVAVIDDGYQLNHYDLDLYDYVNITNDNTHGGSKARSHGISISGIISATKDNNRGR